MLKMLSNEIFSTFGRRRYRRKSIDVSTFIAASAKLLKNVETNFRRSSIEEN
jgi:hypothetical protein